ncbi:MAG: EF-P lysine aminoacylase EpmA [Geminicoccaceae bacterium]|nr:EF-P lysine aminoacylase EpmA [Geminicoccaceae bacterium]MDW8340733.1 EF-P lysine aminoacylase EpmA [Geminicoccaceae bacterium]
MSRSLPWWAPERHADRRPFLLARNRILRAFRRFFEDRGFIEVDPCCLQHSPGNEPHLHAFATRLRDPAGRPVRGLFLHTSPEFACKKLLAAGERRIVAIAHVFRDRESGPLHHPEFTMVEWYRAEEPYTRLMEDCAELLAVAAEAAGVRRFVHAGIEADPFAPPERISVAEAFARFAGIDLLATVSADGSTDRAALARQAEAAGIRVAPDDDWSDIFSRVLVARIEPHLGRGRATILDAYPLPEAALARKSPLDPRTAERFELYLCGVELANAFGELTDPDEQRTRFAAAMALKERLYGERYPLDEELLSALALVPPASGIALGFDRLVMLATGARRIEEVLWAPVPLDP